MTDLVPSSNKKQLKTYTDMQKTFLEHLGGEAGGDIRKAMRLAGYSENTQIREVVIPLRQEIIDLAENLLALNSVKAVMGLGDVIDNPGQMGAGNIVSAAKEILDRVGVSKKQEGVTQIKADNVFILPAKESKKVKTVELDSTEYTQIDESDKEA
jgi:hypothetical protein